VAKVSDTIRLGNEKINMQQIKKSISCYGLLKHTVVTLSLNNNLKLVSRVIGNYLTQFGEHFIYLLG
jgi:hypothetical protein